MAEVAQALNIKPAVSGFRFNGVLWGRLILGSLHRKVRRSNFKEESPVRQTGKDVLADTDGLLEKGYVSSAKVYRDCCEWTESYFCELKSFSVFSLLKNTLR